MQSIRILELPSFAQKLQSNSYLMFLPSFPNSTLNLFLVASVKLELPTVESHQSSLCRHERGKGSEHVELGDDGPRTR